MSKPTHDDRTWQREEVDSPCVQVCIVHPETRLCLGCARSIDEIASWSRMKHEDRQRIMAELPRRNAAPATRRGGRAGRKAR